MDAPQKNSPPEKIAPPPIAWHRETVVAVRLGLSRDTVRTLRGQLLTEHVHWEHQHRRIEINDEGLRILTGHCHATPPPAAVPGQKPAPVQFSEGPSAVKAILIGPPGNPGGSSADVKLKAWESPQNRAILVAYLPGTDPKNRRNHVRVKVRDNANFVPHMEITARLVSPPDLYELVGACPRWRGSW